LLRAFLRRFPLAEFRRAVARRGITKLRRFDVRFRPTIAKKVLGRVITTCAAFRFTAADRLSSKFLRRFGL
jgi:hypothetical protein